MSKWAENFNAHPFIGAWSSLFDLINDEELIEKANEDSIQDIARLKKVLTYLNGIFEKIDPELTPIAHLKNLQNTSQSCFSELNAFKGNGNVGHIQNSNTQADQLLILFQQLPASIYAVSPENIKDVITEYSETIGSYISKYRSETESSVEELANRVEELNADIEIKENKLSELATEIHTVEQTIQQQTSEFNTQYQNSEKDRADKFTKVYDKYASKSDDEFEKNTNKIDEEFKLLSTK